MQRSEARRLVGGWIDAPALTALVITLVFWSAAFAAIRAGLVAYSPGHLALLRFLIASAVLAAYGVVTRMRLPLLKDVPQIAALGFIGITGYHLPLSFGEITVTAGAASLLIASSPVFTALFAMFLLKERLRVWGWIGIIISFGGAALIALGEGKAMGFDANALLILVAAVCTALYSVFQKPLLTRYSPIEFTSYAIWAGTFFMLVFAPGLLETVQAAPLDATLAIVFLGVFPAALSYVTWSYTLSRAPASKAATFLYLTPALAILIAWGWLGEVPSIVSLVGGGIALGGVIMVNTLGR
jgi:drug/metabolite transporter (DMT)-like permease